MSKTQKNQKRKNMVQTIVEKSSHNEGKHGRPSIFWKLRGGN